MHQVHLHQSQTKQLNTEQTNTQLVHAAAKAQQRAHQSQSEGDINQLDCALPTHDCSLPCVLRSLQRCQSLRCEGEGEGMVRDGMHAMSLLCCCGLK